MIYFAQLPTGSIKIGYSANVPLRMYQLRLYYGEELALLHVMDGDRAAEREIHARFAAHRFGPREQFRPVPEIMEFIGRPVLASANPDAIEVMERPVIPMDIMVSVEDRNRLLVAAAMAGKSMSSYLRALVDRHLDEIERPKAKR